MSAKQTDEAGVRFLLNGQGHEAPVGTSVADLLRRLELPADRVAVELDRKIVRQPDRETAMIGSGSSIEIVEFVGGG